jgi:adenylosuccinate synthase
LHLLPSGVFYPKVINVIGPGVALNLRAFLAELQGLIDRGVPAPQIKVSNRAQLLLPYHQLLDGYEEERLGARSFGSTKQGIAPFYADKYLKLGVQVADLGDQSRLQARLAQALATKNVLLQHLYQKPLVTVAEVMDHLAADTETLAPYVADTLTLLQDGLSAGKTVLLEGQLGALRDPDHGIYPYPTSSSPLAGFATVGAGVPPQQITRIIAVTKAYSSCVGAGPFVTELQGGAAEELRRRGGSAGEYGATTGRPRRVGWFDAVATCYGCRVQGATEVALTNLDVLGYLDEIPLCTAYAIDGERATTFPTTGPLERAQPVLTTLPGWRSDLTAIRRYQDLPRQTQHYVETIEELIATPIRWLSVGPERNAMILR